MPETKIIAANLPSDAISPSTELQKQGCRYLRDTYRPSTVSRWTLNIDEMKPGKTGRLWCRFQPQKDEKGLDPLVLDRERLWHSLNNFPCRISTVSDWRCRLPVPPRQLTLKLFFVFVSLSPDLTETHLGRGESV